MKSSQPKPPGDDTTSAEVEAPAPPPATIVALAPPPDAAAPDLLAAGVEAARRIEESTDRVRRARAHAKRGKKNGARRSARRQLKRLLQALHLRQEQVLSQGILPEDHHTLAAHLHAVDRAVDEFLESRRPKRGALKQVRKAAKTLRKSL